MRPAAFQQLSWIDLLRLASAIAEKVSLLTTAAVFVVFFPPLRKRLLGVGRRGDKAMAALFGIGLSVWGALLGFPVQGQRINVRDIGVLIGAILGGRKAGALTGLVGGLFYALQVAPATDTKNALWGMAASVIDGALAGHIAKVRPDMFAGVRVFTSSLMVQCVHLCVVGLGLVATSSVAHYLPALPAQIVKVLINSLGVTLIVTVARLLIVREEESLKLAHAESAAHAASLEALRRRIEPHFLFNALNTLRAIIRMNPERAREFVSSLADMYRYLLTHKEDATLQDEINHAKAYLEIEKVRVGEDRLSWDFAIADELKALRIPALLLQPLVENAIVHGIGKFKGRGSIQFSVQVVEDKVRIELLNQSEGEAIQGDRPQGSGTALATLRQRLQRRFDPSACIELWPSERGCKVVVEFQVN